MLRGTKSLAAGSNDGHELGSDYDHTASLNATWLPSGHRAYRWLHVGFIPYDRLQCGGRYLRALTCGRRRCKQHRLTYTVNYQSGVPLREPVPHLITPRPRNIAESNVFEPESRPPSRNWSQRFEITHISGRSRMMRVLWPVSCPSSAHALNRAQKGAPHRRYPFPLECPAYLRRCSRTLPAKSRVWALERGLSRALAAVDAISAEVRLAVPDCARALPANER